MHLALSVVVRDGSSQQLIPDETSNDTISLTVAYLSMLHIISEYDQVEFSFCGVEIVVTVDYKTLTEL